VSLKIPESTTVESFNRQWCRIWIWSCRSSSSMFWIYFIYLFI